METDYLHDFLVFSESMNYARASEALFMSHPTLRAHISALEKSIGAPLVEKVAGRTVLTSAGRQLVENGGDVISLVNRISRECQRLSAEVITVNVRLDIYSGFRPILEKAKRRYQQDNPGCSVSIMAVTHSCNRGLALADGVVDFDIGYVLNLRESGTRVPSLDFHLDENIFLQAVEPVCFWCTPSNPLFDKETIKLADLAEKSFLSTKSTGAFDFGRQIRQLIEDAGFSVRMRHLVCDSFYEYFQYDLGESIGIGYQGVVDEVRSFRPAGDLRLFTIEDQELHMEIYTAYREDVLDPRKIGFISALRSVASEAMGV